MFGHRASGSDCFSQEQKDWLRENYWSKGKIVTCNVCGVLFEENRAQVVREGSYSRMSGSFAPDLMYFCMSHRQKYSPGWAQHYESVMDPFGIEYWKLLPKEPKEDPCADIAPRGWAVNCHVQRRDRM